MHYGRLSQTAALFGVQMYSVFDKDFSHHAVEDRDGGNRSNPANPLAHFEAIEEGRMTRPSASFQVVRRKTEGLCGRVALGTGTFGPGRQEIPHRLDEWQPARCFRQHPRHSCFFCRESHFW